MRLWEKEITGKIAVERDRGFITFLVFENNQCIVRIAVPESRTDYLMGFDLKNISVNKMLDLLVR